MLIVHLFVSYAHVDLCHFFSSSWYQGLAAASACRSSWTFRLPFFRFLMDALSGLLGGWILMRTPSTAR